MTVLLGPARAGKTSLLRLMAGLEAPTTGRVSHDGREMHRIPARRRKVGLVHQRFVNYPGKTVYENIAVPLRRAGVPAAGIDAKVREVAGVLHLEDLLRRRPSELSGGQQQRTALARALVRSGGLLLLDEPLVNLDYKLREELRDELRAVFARHGTTVVYATSDPAEALQLGGRTVVLDEGRVLQQGDALEVYRRPLKDRVGELTSVPPMNLIEGRIEAGRLHVGSVATAPLAKHLLGLAPGTYRLGIRPHRLHTGAAEAGALVLRGIVEFAEISGSETFLHVRLNEIGTDSVIHRAGTKPHDPGEVLEVSFDPAAVYAYSEDGRLAAAPEPQR
jgi:glycerol transport system ATP-binding protein